MGRDSRQARLAAALGISEDAAAQILSKSRPVRQYHARHRKKCRVCGGDFLPSAPAQLRCDACRVFNLLGRAV